MSIFNKVFGKKDNENRPERIAIEKNTVYAPVTGRLIALGDFPDDVFSEGILGQGCGIEPEEEEVKAPFHGEVIELQDSKHAVGLLSEDGIELLIHVGIDTVGMNGKGFETFVKKGDTVVKGQRLIRFDKKEIHAAGLKDTVAVVITNSGEYSSVNVAEPGIVDNDKSIMTVVQ